MKSNIRKIIISVLTLALLSVSIYADINNDLHIKATYTIVDII